MIALTVVTIALSLHLWSFRSPLLGAHSFRQTQTAFQAREFAEHGIDLLHPRLPVLGPPWEVPFEFPAFQALASVPMRLGLSADTSIRLTALAWFAASAVLLFGLMRYVASRAAAFGALVAFALSPFALAWAGASLMEYLVIACVLAFCGPGSRGEIPASFGWRSSPSSPARSGWPSRARRPGPTSSRSFSIVRGTSCRESATGCGPGCLLGSGPSQRYPWSWAWCGRDTRTRSRKRARQRGGSRRANLTDWNFGTLQQRLEGVNWVLVGDRIESLLVGRYFWAGLIIVAVIFAQRRAFWIGMALTVVLPVVVFFNLFVVHDYYLIAMTPGIAALLGLTTDLIWRHGRKRIPALLVIIGLAALWFVPLYWTTKDYWRDVAFNPPKRGIEPVAARVIRRAVPSNEPLVLQGLGWDPTTLYYAHRRGLMLDPRIATPAVADLLRSHDFRYWYAIRPDRARERPSSSVAVDRQHRPSGLSNVAGAEPRPRGRGGRRHTRSRSDRRSVVEWVSRSPSPRLTFAVTGDPTRCRLLPRRRGSCSTTPNVGGPDLGRSFPAPVPGFPALVLRRGFADLGAPVRLIVHGRRNAERQRARGA